MVRLTQPLTRRLTQPLSMPLDALADLGSARNYSAEANAIFAAATTAGWAPTTAWKNAADTLIAAHKASGAWDDWDVYWRPVAGNAGASYINWKNPGTFDIIPNYVDRPIVVPFRGLGSDGTSSNFRTGFTPSVNAVKGRNNSASLWTWISDATPGRQSAADLGGGGATASTVMTVRNATDVARILINDTNNGSATLPNSSASGLHWIQRISSATKRVGTNGAQLGADIGRTVVGAGPAPSTDGELYINGLASSVFNPHQIQMVAYGASQQGREAAIYNAELAFTQAVIPAATRGFFCTAGDSGMHGSGGTTNVSLGQLLNYYTGVANTDVSAGGATLAEQATAIIAAITATPSLASAVWVLWDLLANGSGGPTADAATVQSILDAGVSPSKLLLLTQLVKGPPNSGVTDVDLANLQTYRGLVLAKGIVCPDTQGFWNGISPAGTSKTAGLVDLSLLQADATHPLATSADLFAAWVLPQLNAMP